MGNIVLLDELTINKIAAGEVIERPASVIKEMVENSIDAGANNITVEIKNGGISFIRITDNGKGIARDDVELAFERHATSKIRSAADLENVKSMGFRGEALASISAIANVELVTKTETSDIGTRIVVEGGNTLNIDDIGCSKGTTITVRNLFFNTPVRYKFLKKDFTESGYIEDVVTRIALIHPEIAIKFINTGRTVIQTNGNGDLQAVIYSIFGKEVAQNLVNVDYDFDGIKVMGVVGKPEIARSNRGNQIFFVNKRYIKDKTISSAVEQAYKGILLAGKFAFAVLNIEMNPSRVDVNVHPAKLEVRFQDESSVFKAVFHSIKDELFGLGIKSEKEEQQEIKEASKTAFKMDENKFKELANDTYKIKNLKKEEEPMKDKNIEENVIESIFNSRKSASNGNFEINKEEEEIKADNFSKEEDISTEKLDNIMDNIKILESFSEGDVFENLRKLQEELRQEVEADPSLKLTDEYKQMEEKYQSEITKEEETEQEKNSEEIDNEEIFKIFEEKEETEKIEEPVKEKSIEEIIEDKIENNEKIDDEINNEEKSEVIEDNNVNLEKIEENIDEDNIDPEKIEENINEDNIDSEKIEENIDEDNTNSEKIEEYIDEDNFKPAIFLKEKDNKEKQDELEESKPLDENIVSFETMYKEIFGKEPYGGRKLEEPKKEEEGKDYYSIDTNIEDSNISMFEKEATHIVPKYKFIGLAFEKYVVLEIDNELYILDTHSACERIMYEKIKRKFYQEGKKTTQLLLLPDVITLNSKEMGIVLDNITLFNNTGFVVEEFGENTIRLSGVPDICAELETDELFKKIIDEINTVARTDKIKKEEKFLYTIASKISENMNVDLTPEGIEELMKELTKYDTPFIGINEKPIVIKMSKYEIERKFARK